MGPICLGVNESHIYPNMCARFGCGPTVVSREEGGTDTLPSGMNGYRITLMAVAPSGEYQSSLYLSLVHLPGWFNGDIFSDKM